MIERRNIVQIHQAVISLSSEVKERDYLLQLSLDRDVLHFCLARLLCDIAPRLTSKQRYKQHNHRPPHLCAILSSKCKSTSLSHSEKAALYEADANGSTGRLSTKFISTCLRNMVSLDSQSLVGAGSLLLAAIHSRWISHKLYKHNGVEPHEDTR